ncbi:3-mercaptopyruvate sulfurtransferase [Bathymodiolus japonicus methanotrophic gill symbiont]|uniref:3-mercaptopyruvate sulfurtransferase n=1 Tax=Bathymodiolus japonicus methanotrophic gill symbiont TaxID=113269 RepID=UPI001E4D8BBD|nr:3-mercaptopyruvate sulfurtransferase [Bathymodiolus japonicus methanotrophic gill symbiont]
MGITMTDSALVSCTWLAENLANPKLVILDATFYLPRQQRNAKEEYQQHILGALFFDIDQVADQSSPLPHTIPSANQFSDAVGKMGIDHNSHIIIYDNNHFFAAARVWWMFRIFGHTSVQILDGGLKHWKHKNFPLDTKQPSPISKLYKTDYRPELICDLTQMLKIQQSGVRQILDARSADSFQGQRALAAADLRPGHIPHSINLPYAHLTDAEHGTLLSRQKLHLLFESTQVNLSQPMVTSCGSGVSAAVLLLALYQIGLTNVPMYDGSWAEWGRQAGTPIEQ